jgi:hypothetical protein
MDWQNDRGGSNRGTILVASGNPLFPDIVGEMVATCGFAPAYLVGGEAPMTSLARTRPRVIICDCDAPTAGIQDLIAEASSRYIPLVLSGGQTPRGADVDAPRERVAWLSLPISQDAFNALLDDLLLQSADDIRQATANVRGIASDAAVATGPPAREIGRRREAATHTLEGITDRSGRDQPVDLAPAELSDVEDLRSAIANALAATPVYDQSLRRCVWTYVGAERDAGTPPGRVIVALTELVDAARIVPTSVALALTRRVILWCVEAYFGQLGGGIANRDGSAFHGDGALPGPMLVSNR